ncbi:MAG TPA: type III pantothenate kinase [Candidatus Limnocylindrales bacterium]
MLLAIDIGNTNVTTSVVRHGSLGPARRAPTVRGAPPEELGATLRALLARDGIAGEQLDAVVLSSVVPPLTLGVRAIAEAMHLPLLVADATTVPIPIRVDRAAEVGADRLVNAFAAARLHAVPAVVLDFGTATTVDAVGPDGAYLGGAIAPGLELGLDALATRTALLPRVELLAPERAIATSTVAAIQAGAVLGYQALAAGLLARVRAELSETTGIAAFSIVAIATGGLSAAPWAREIDGVDVIDPELTLRGLATLWEEVGGVAEGRGAADRRGAAERAPSARMAG